MCNCVHLNSLHDKEAPTEGREGMPRMTAVKYAMTPAPR